jgi:hypothetical protein
MFYFRAHFRCSQCNEISSRVVKINVRSKFDACEKIGRTFCHLCISQDALELIEVEELHLAHLEEFICWSTRDTLVNTSTVDIISSQ